MPSFYLSSFVNVFLSKHPAFLDACDFFFFFFKLFCKRGNCFQQKAVSDQLHPRPAAHDMQMMALQICKPLGEKVGA